MSDYGSILAMLDDIEDKVSTIRDELGRLQGQQAVAGVDLLGMPGPDAAAGAIAPTVPDADPEIVGGDPTTDFPDCCAVGNQTGYYCSGTLIAPNVVVTADHCHNVTQVFLGGNDVTRPDEGETITVIRQLSHPEVDLSVLVLAQDSTVPPRHVAQGSETAGAQSAMLVGFGRIDLQGTVGYGIRRKVREPVPIMSLDCSEAGASKQYGCLPGRELVAGHRGLALDTCQGDSGGPLYIEQADGAYFLLGATSRGARGGFTSCGDGGIYVRVDLCLDWIREATGALIDGPLPPAA